MGKRKLSAALIGGITLVWAGPALAQAVEENPAPLVMGQQVARLDAEVFADRPQDATPFGVDLAGLVLVDAKANGGKLVAKGADGVDVAYGGPTAQNEALRRRLAPFLGQPLSFKLLSDIQAEITAFYREAGRSLVSVSVPQQEITGGRVQVNVTTFVLAATKVEGAVPGREGFLSRQVRLRPGQEVDTDTLLDDVNWLNQNPYRHVSVVFAPGTELSSTELTLRVRNGRTWSGYAGLSNAGTEDTGVLRVFGGVNAAPLTWNDQQLSYQMTASPQNLSSFRLWDSGTEKGYVSHALSYFVPITLDSGFRTKLSFSASHISSYSEPGGVLTTGTKTIVVNGEAAFPLPRTSGRFALVPELYLAAEWNQYDKQIYLFGIPLSDPEATELLHGAVGLRTGISGKVFGKSARGSADVAYYMGRQETQGDAAFDYAYVKATLKQEIFLDHERSLALRVTAQHSEDELHPLEQMALGGDGTVRGYPVNGVAGETAVAGSVEYRMPHWSFKAAGQDVQFSPHVFADWGHVSSVATGNESLSSVGFGGEVDVGNGMIGSFDLSHVLTGAGATESGATSLAFQFTARF